MTLTQARLKELLSYDPDTGEFMWVRRGRGFRFKCGSVGLGGYISIRVDKKLYLAHRLAFLYAYGELPEFDIDHINGNKKDNRLVNLRQATRAQNTFNVGVRRNNTSGYKGVSWDKGKGKFAAYAMICGKKKHLGRFDAAEEASAAYKAFAIDNHGKFIHRSIHENSTD